MVYNYPKYKYYFYLAVGWSCYSLLFHYKDIDKIIAGDVKKTLIFLLFFQIVIIPLAFLLIGFYLKSIHITTSASEIVFCSPFNKINLKWDEIKFVKRERWNIKVQTDNIFISFKPHISPASSIVKIKPGENIFKHCELLKEIHSKAINAKFVNFPEDTFAIKET